MANIGEQSLNPDSGYKRYDTSIELFDNPLWVTTTNSSLYLGSSRQTTALNTPMIFYFYGTKLRLIGTKNQDRQNAQVVVDGSVYSYNANATSNLFQYIIFELTGLENKRHMVTITKTSGTIAEIDAIDIDDFGRLVLKDEIIISQEVAIGKRIRAHYFSPTNSMVGVFNGLFQENGDFINKVNPISNPNGDFYFIVSDVDVNGNYKCIADRNIQSNISADNLSSYNINTGLTSKYVSSRQIVPKFINSNSITSNGYTYSVSASSSVNSTYLPYKAFTQTNVDNTDCWLITGSIGWLQIDMGHSINLNRYNMWSRFNISGDAPKTWTISASNTGLFAGEEVILDTQNISTAWLNLKSFELPNNNSFFRYYRLNITNNFGSTTTGVGEWQLEEKNKVNILDNRYDIRLLTGGLSASETSNEWYQYIVNSNLNNNIVAGSNDVWNWNGRWSLTSTIPSTGNRSIRGNTSSGGYSTYSSSSSATTVNFRPIMELMPVSPYIDSFKDLNSSIVLPYNRVGDFNANLTIPARGKMSVKVNVSPLIKQSLPSSVSVNQVNNINSTINIPLHGMMSTKVAIVQPPRTTVQLKSIQDAFINSVNPRLNYGNTGDLLLGHRQSDNATYRSLLQFDLSSIATDMKVTRGVLKLYFDFENMEDLNFEIDILKDLWTENGVTYANQPTIVKKIAESKVGQVRGYLEIDILETVSGWQKQTINNNGLMLKSLDESLNLYYRFYSRENSQYPPLLEVEYYDPTPKSYDYGDLGGAVKINRYSNRDITSQLQIKALFENNNLPSTMHLTNLNLMIEGSVTIIRNNLKSKIIVKRYSQDDLNSTIVAIQNNLSDIGGRLSVNPIYIKGNVKIKRTETNELQATFVVRELLNENLNGFINITNPDLKSKINIQYISSIDGSINIKYGDKKDLNSNIFVIGKANKDLESTININQYNHLPSIVNINSGYLKSSIIIPHKDKKDLTSKINIKTFFAEDLFSSLAVGKTVDLPAELEIILGRPNNFILYF